MKYKTDEANLKLADTNLKMGDKFFWAPIIPIMMYFFKPNMVSFSVVIIISFIFLFIGVSLRKNALEIYDNIYSKKNTKIK